MIENYLDKETIQARVEFMKQLRIAKNETKKLKSQWEKISNILSADSHKKAA